jgi:DNA primase (bacterial type)
VRTYQDASAEIDLAALQAATQSAAELFTASPRAHAARAYLRQRGIDPNELGPAWIIGYAPPGWTRLVDALRDRFDERTLLAAGLAGRSSRGTLIDVFRDRIILGIRNPADERVAGFIGRDLSGHPHAPKYLNTCQHVLFDKSQLLFGLVEGQHAGPQQPVVVEGPLDVLAIAGKLGHDQRDFLPIAPCGTAFTAAHARHIAEVAFADQSPVVIAMDGDAPGRAAALKAGEQLRQIGLDVRIAALPNGSDPAEHLARPDASTDPFRAENAMPLLTAHAEQAIALQGDRMQWVEGRLGALHAIAGYLATYPPSYAARQVGWLAAMLDVEPSTVTHELAGAFRAGSRPSDARRFEPAERGIELDRDRILGATL